MTTTAQDALKAFEDAWITTNWAGMTNTQKQTHIAQHYGLKIAAAKEIEANRIEDEANQQASNTARLNQIRTYLLNHGFACDNSEADWDKLYNRPHIFGANWKTQADYQRSLSTGVDYFLNHAYNLWLTLQ